MDVSGYRVERCPKCRSKEIQRSRRKNIADVALGFVFRPWRCTVCFYRFYRPRWMKGVPRRVDLMNGFEKVEKKVAQPEGAAAAARAGT